MFWFCLLLDPKLNFIGFGVNWSWGVRGLMRKVHGEGGVGSTVVSFVDTRNFEVLRKMELNIFSLVKNEFLLFWSRPFVDEEY